VADAPTLSLLELVVAGEEGLGQFRFFIFLQWLCLMFFLFEWGLAALAGQGVFRPLQEQEVRIPALLHQHVSTASSLPHCPPTAAPAVVEVVLPLGARVVPLAQHLRIPCGRYRDLQFIEMGSLVDLGRRRRAVRPLLPL
jgi:hypothetical protein